MRGAIPYKLGCIELDESGDTKLLALFDNFTSLPKLYLSKDAEFDTLSGAAKQ